MTMSGRFCTSWVCPDLPIKHWSGPRISSRTSPRSASAVGLSTDEERHRGMRCIATAIYNQYGEAVAGISVSGPTVRMPDSRLAELAALVMQAGEDITDAIGGLRPERDAGR